QNELSFLCLSSSVGAEYFKDSKPKSKKETKKRKASLKIKESIKLTIPEPSGISFSSNGQHLYIVSDKGKLYKTDLSGNVIKKAKYRGSDFEGVCTKGGKVFVVDETLRQILEFDSESLKLKESQQYVYNGATNRSWESIVFDPNSERLLAFTEKLPVLMFEFNKGLEQKAVHQINKIKEIAGATYHNGLIWVVSDEDRTVYALSPKSLKIKKSWKIPVLNPEGITFSPNGTLWIISDAMAKIYKFDVPD
ncbi:MAG: SdiA-regulated domain-containing protein, partial [Bacteroidota bacterium]